MELHIRSVLKEQGPVKDVNVKEIHDITLQDGCLPAIGHNAILKVVATRSTGHTDQFQLEPAIWFKVNIIEVILVDCNKR